VPEIRLKAENNKALINHQISELVDQNSRVIEFGCGKGDLLLKLSSKIDFGIGIDHSKNQIDQAILRCKHKGVSNIHFYCEDLTNHYTIDDTYDLAIASLFFHVIPRQDSIKLIHKIVALSRTTIIAAICKPTNLLQRSMLWLDQKMSPHYNNFTYYQDFGYLAGKLENLPHSDVKFYNTSIPFVKIYMIN